jgi:acyl-lipid (7-3)-desaturase (Delta-4 desaturase)
MAPDADKIRQRRVQQQRLEDDAAVTDSRAASIRSTNLKSLGPTEVAIDGVIYDIANFDHPGGESIHIFGGNDCTVQYKMIHPYHTAKHLEKMTRVGTVPDYSSE